ncbi:unnamed protein product [Penicillium roqueforti FM164]|uniref:Uncharacterized protein n=1 Tax=Penicillium roqueforti (strain FM164) TaxID=1365484 RepID=W6R4E9_PENRF|nr:unnamed protein product [Penicillium roqueforti FM164]
MGASHPGKYHSVQKVCSHCPTCYPPNNHRGFFSSSYTPPNDIAGATQSKLALDFRYSRRTIYNTLKRFKEHNTVKSLP